MSDVLEDIRKKTPLPIRIKLTMQTYFLHEGGGFLMMPLDETGEHHLAAVKKNTEIMKEYNELIEYVMEDIEKWKADGSPE